MPVTARLLQRLHETLGDEATNDLFSWWDEAAAVNRTGVREVADQYFARFEARLEQVEARLEARLEKGLAEVRAETQVGLAAVRAEMASQRAELIKWMFIFWAGTVIPLAGLLIALNRIN